MNKFEKIIIAFIVCTCTFLHAEDYTFGDGMQIGDSPVIIGGYTSLTYEKKKNSRRVDIDHTALLAYGEYEHFDFLSEFEIAHLYKKISGDHPDESSSTTIHTERFFGNYYINDNERIRLGKFHSDIGFWNQMPINVLRDTTASPRLVRDFFPMLTTGINYEITQPSNTINRISLTLQNNHNIDIGYNNFDTDRHYSIACDIVDQDSIWRFSGGYFRAESAQEAMYLLGALKIKKDEGDFILESILRREIQNEEYSYDIYAEKVWHVITKHDVILGAEVEKAPITQIHDGTIVLGYTYRPLGNIAFKGGYEAHQESSLNRWIFSFSVLF